MKVLINVTQEDINQGVKDDCQRCPIALAIERATQKACDVGLESIYTLVSLDTPREKIAVTPLSVQAFICDFDDGLPVKPYAFKLDFK